MRSFSMGVMLVLAGLGACTRPWAPPPPPDERCNAADDDQDGTIDEGYADVDEDGWADCVDVSCELEASGRADLGSISCTDADLPVADPWRASLVGSTALALHGTPLVGPLRDTDGDGRTTPADRPVLLINERANSSGWYRLKAVDPETFEVFWTADSGINEAILVDVDRDGMIDVVHASGGGITVRRGHDGELLWSRSLRLWSRQFSLAAGDLNGDGRAEILVDQYLLRAEDGLLLHDFGWGDTASQRNALFADLDQDGVGELLADGAWYGPDLRARYRVPTETFGTWFPFVVDTDGDGAPEVVYVHGNELVVVDTDGTVLSRAAVSNVSEDYPCIGDLDGDGAPELAWNGPSELYAVELDGTQLMRISQFGTSGCSTFDFDRDGRDELVVLGSGALQIFDVTRQRAVLQVQPDGPILAQVAGAPTIADIDGDGSAEILVGSVPTDYREPTSWRGLAVFAHPAQAWPGAAARWDAHPYQAGRFGPDGSIPRETPSFWQEGTRVSGPAPYANPLPDLQVSILDECVASCEDDGQAWLAVQVHNRGQLGLPADAVEVVARVGSAEVRAEVPHALAPGHAETIALAVPASFAGEGLEVSVWADEFECDEDNNTVESRGAQCDSP